MDEDAAAAAKALEAYGERFMAMFEETPKPKSKGHGKKGLGAKAGGKTGQKATAEADKSKQGKQKSKAASQLAPGARPAAAPQLNAGATPGKKTPGHTLVQQASPAVTATPGGKIQGPTKGIKRPRDDIDQILFNHRNEQKLAAQSVPSVTHTSSRFATPTPGGSVDQALAKRQRKLFMSAKAGRIHEDVDDDLLTSPLLSKSEFGGNEDDNVDDDMHLNPEEFKALQQEVERLGASALDKRERKKWQAAMLTRLGARPDKAPRRAASIGKGLANVNAARDARKLEEAMQAGMVKRKGSGKKKKREAARTRERGLEELGPGFRSGMLRLKGSPMGGSGGKRPGGKVNTGATRAALHKTKGLGGMRAAGGGKKKGRKGNLKLPF